MYGAFVVAVIPLGFVIFYVVQKGLPQVLTPDWFTEDIPAVSPRARAAAWARPSSARS